VPDDWLHELALTTRPAWMRDAACREHPEVSWFPMAGINPAAIAICRTCLVRVECLTHALNHGTDSEFGIWGGLSALARRHERQRAA